ncbi:substrate-binding domain-containing protein [Parasphingorhabdus sp. DH2-15]|uniref:substrate-binding domain-containing protein n=1 Tax=Parasphingorhabdus sp. DH2-15 TaxID=3444112 RepID=UPI003F68940F
MRLNAFPLLIACLALTACQDQAGLVQSTSRDEIRIVGSSTVFPYAKAVADQFAQTGRNPSPILESTGTGGGIQLFCSGIGASFPDIVNASRRMKASELKRCKEKGVEDVVEIQVGIDGVALAQSREGADLNVNLPQIYQAIAAQPYGKPNGSALWSDVAAELPETRLYIYGPPKTSGTRESLTDLMMEPGCLQNPAMQALKESDEERVNEICTDVRTDGVYVETGENDNLIIQKLISNPGSIGIFGYGYLEKNLDKVRGVKVNGVDPTYDTISSGEYPGARPLYIYVKKRHIDIINGLDEYIMEFLTAGTRTGYLSEEGMIAMPDPLRQVMIERLRTLPPLSIEALE